MYYIISLKHTRPDDAFLTLWGPDNCGYFYSKEEAGIYEAPIEGYHDSDENIPIHENTAERLFMDLKNLGGMRIIPNNEATWNFLGFELSGKKLIKKPNPAQP